MIKSDYAIPSLRSDLVIFNHKNRIGKLLDVKIPADETVKIKKTEKLDK